MRVTMIGAAVGLMILAGCDGSTEPAQPPTQEDALTTATVAPPTSDEVEATTEAAATTAEPTEEAGAVPELPDEATERTQEGAEAFVEHYLEQLNSTGLEPRTGVLEPLASDSCGTCGQFATAVSDMARDGEHYDAPLTQLREIITMQTADSAISMTTVDQPDVQVIGRDGDVVETYPGQEGVRMEFHLSWSDAWLVDKILLVED